MASVCPCCGYTVTDEQALRCPRCNHVLQPPPSCPGECRDCVKKRRIVAIRKRADKQGS